MITKEQVKFVPFIEVNKSGKNITKLEIMLMGELDQSILTLGKVIIFLIDEKKIPASILDFINEDLKYHPSFDQSLLRTIGTLMDSFNEKKNEIHGSLAFITNFFIYPEYRQRKLSKPFLWLILKALKENFDVDFVLLEPSPFEINQFETKSFTKEKNRLEKIYSKSGFLKRVNNGKTYMFVPLAQRKYDIFR